MAAKDCFIIIAVLPTGEFMIYQLEKNFHTSGTLPNKIDGILILSGGTNHLMTKEILVFG